MANKFFNYSFQIHRTRRTGIIFIIFIVLLGVGSFIFYKSNNSTLSINKLKYKTVFGMNDFEDNSCDKSYKINFKKNTCGSICIKSLKKDKNYLNTIRETMIENGFVIEKIGKYKINNKNWDYFVTNNFTSISYYKYDYFDKTYVVEIIDQTNHLVKSKQKECKKIFNEFESSLEFK